MKKSLHFSFILLAIIFQSCSGVFSKYAAITLSEITLFAVITNVFYILSLICLVLQAIIWQQALIHYPLSFAYPFLSCVNFIILLASAILFHEGITLANILGLILVSVGITVISYEAGVTI